jgi:ABC-type dipeptide/oligopeptide/nickel transport system permease subunit
MPLLTVVLILIAVGILLALVNKYGPPYVDGTILRIINIVVILAVIVWLLKIVGVWEYLSKVTV